MFCTDFVLYFIISSFYFIVSCYFSRWISSRKNIENFQGRRYVIRDDKNILFWEGYGIPQKGSEWRKVPIE